MFRIYRKTEYKYILLYTVDVTEVLAELDIQANAGWELVDMQCLSLGTRLWLKRRVWKFGKSNT